MPRPPRHQDSGCYYHVVSRGNNKQIVFDDELRTLFLHRLGDVAERHSWRVLAYALMRNHYHLVVKIGTAGLSNGMCELNAWFAKVSNSRFNRIDHCFGRRFWSANLDTEHYLLMSIRYGMWNPPRAGVCAKPGESTWTSFRASIGLDTPSAVLAVDDLLALFHPDRSLARRALRDFVAEGRVRCQAPWDGPPAT